MTIKLHTAPAVEPITRANVKTKLGIASADTTSDTQIDWMIPAARRYVEQRTGRALITQTWQMYLDDFSDVISLPLGNIQSITHIKYMAQDGNVTTMNAADYQSDLIGSAARVMPSYSASTWPTARSNTFNAVEVQFVAGFGLAVAIPEDIIEALYRIVGHWLNNQAAIEQGTSITRVPFAVEQMLSPYVLPTFGPA